MDGRNLHFQVRSLLGSASNGLVALFAGNILSPSDDVPAVAGHQALQQRRGVALEDCGGEQLRLILGIACWLYCSADAPDAALCSVARLLLRVRIARMVRLLWARGDRAISNAWQVEQIQ